MSDSATSEYFTFAIVKPDAHARGLTGEIISRFERKGFLLHAMELIEMTLEQASELYKPHEGKEFYEELCGFMTGGSCVLMVWMKPFEPIDTGRKMVASIRDDYAWDVRNNCVHASDSHEAFVRESAIFFPNLFTSEVSS